MDERNLTKIYMNGYIISVILDNNSETTLQDNYRLIRTTSVGFGQYVHLLEKGDRPFRDEDLEKELQPFEESILSPKLDKLLSR